MQLEKERARRNKYQNWKDRSKIVPVCRHDIIYIENPKGFITTLLEVINSIMLKNTKSACKNQLCFCTLTINYLKGKLGKQYNLH